MDADESILSPLVLLQLSSLKMPRQSPAMAILDTACLDQVTGQPSNSPRESGVLGGVGLGSGSGGGGSGGGGSGGGGGQVVTCGLGLIGPLSAATGVLNERMRIESDRQLDGESLKDPTLAKVVDILVRVYGPQAVYLFGSAARGEASPDSDYDLLLVAADSAPAELRRPRAGYQALWELGTGADITVCTRTEFESRLHLKASLPATVLREGKLLYAA